MFIVILILRIFKLTEFKVCVKRVQKIFTTQRVDSINF
jgi:hypothetical protein